MKTLLAALIATAALAAPALAQTLTPWTDPQGHFSFSRPGDWPVDLMNSGGNVTQYAAGLAAAECAFLSISRDTTTSASANAVRTTFQTPFTREQWYQVTQSTPRVFRGGADIQTMSVDQSGFWPVQRATIQSGADRIEAGVTARPGREIWAFCQSYDGRDRAALFNQVLASIATPNDAALRAAIESAAPAPAPAAPPAN